jgi:integrase
MARKYKSFRLPKLRHHKPSGQGVVELSGKQIYLGRYGSEECQKAYDQACSAWLANGKKPINVTKQIEQSAVPKGIAVVEVVEQYLDYAAKYYNLDGEPTRGIERAKMGAKILCQYFGMTTAAEFGPLKLRAIQTELIDAGHCRRYINHLCGQIRRIFKWATSVELIEPFVYQALSTLPGLKMGRSGVRESAPVLPVAPERVAATLPCLGKIVRDMVTIQYLAGCRPQEICNFKPVDIDRSYGDVWIYKPKRHKTAYLGKPRIIPLNVEAQQILLPYLDRPAEHYCFSPRDTLAAMRADRTAKRKTPLSCGNRVGSNRKAKLLKEPADHYTAQSYGKAIAKGCDKAFPAPLHLTPEQVRQWRLDNRWQPNQLRHLTGTEIRAESGLEDAANYLGHADAQITLVYAERDIKRLVEISRKRTIAWTQVHH